MVATHFCIAFQYPLFRIVDCFTSTKSFCTTPTGCFNIRSFGSWIASWSRCDRRSRNFAFQYPLFRIVDCFESPGIVAVQAGSFQYPLFRIVDCFGGAMSASAAACGVSISALSDRGLLPGISNGAHRQNRCFNIRSFGSWIASTP